jgi:TPR repeat protein
MDGRGYPKDNKLAFDWLKKAADKQNPMGLTYLGVMYELGMYGEGLYGANFVGGKAAQPKYQDAFKYYKQAADLGTGIIS